MNAVSARSGAPGDVRDVTAIRLWAGVLLAPAAWIAQGALGWYFGYEACTTFGVGPARVALVVLSLIALVIAAAGGVIAWTNWGAVSPGRHPGHVHAGNRVEFMAAGGVLVSTMFVIGIGWAALSALLLATCGGMR
jgi:hypothetical protein